MELNKHQIKARKTIDFIRARILGRKLGYIMDYAADAIPEGKKWAFVIRGETYSIHNKKGKIIIESIEKSEAASMFLFDDMANIKVSIKTNEKI